VLPTARAYRESENEAVAVIVGVCKKAVSFVNHMRDYTRFKENGK